MRSYVLLAALGSTALTVRLYVLQAALGYTVVRSEPAKMSSKKRRRLTPQANAIATDAVQLIRERANGNDGIFNEACLACTDQPAFLSALGRAPTSLPSSRRWGFQAPVTTRTCRLRQRC